MRPGNTRGTGRRADPVAEHWHLRPERVDAGAGRQGPASLRPRARHAVLPGHVTAPLLPGGQQVQVPLEQPVQGPLVSGLVRPVSVVVADVGTKHRPQMGFVVDEPPVGALGPDGAQADARCCARSRRASRGTAGLALRLGRGRGGGGRGRAGGRTRIGHLRSGLPGGQQRAAGAVPATTLTAGTHGRRPCFIRDDTARQATLHCRLGIPRWHSRARDPCSHARRPIAALCRPEGS